MRPFITILILTNLSSCYERQTNNSDLKNNGIHENANQFIVSAVDAKFPLRIDKAFEEKTKTIQLNDETASRIEEIIKEYAKDVEFYDSSQSYKDTYINTIRLQDSLQTIFLVLLKNHPTGEVNSRVLFYDNQRKEFANRIVDFKIYALYDINNEKLIPTYLKTIFEIASPEIELMDFNKDGINEYKFVRLWHNGTFNAIHTAILAVEKTNIDTLYFCERGLGKFAEKKNCL